MAAIHGTVGTFDSTVDSWTSYTERLEQYFTANDVAEDTKKRAILLSGCGPQTYQLLKNLITPQKPTDKTFADIVTVLEPLSAKAIHHCTAFYFSYPSAETRGNSRRIHGRAEHCKFGGGLNDMLRDRLVCGISDGRTQKRLLAEPELTFSKAFETATALEMAEKNVKELQVPKADKLPVLTMMEGGSRPSSHDRLTSTVGSSCYRCGNNKHLPEDCYFKDAHCRNCGKLGHIARVCRSKKKQGPHSREPKRRQARAHQVQDDSDNASESEEPEYLYAMYNIGEDSKEPLTTKLDTNSTEIEMEVDTGATMSIISHQTYQHLKGSCCLQPTKVRFRTYTGEQIKVIGEIEVTVTLKGAKEQVKLLVVEGDGPSLLGRDWLGKFQWDWHQLHQVSSKSELHRILKRHAAVFKEELGSVKGIRAKIHLKPNSQTKFCRARTVPFAIREKVEKELGRLAENGVITPVQHSEWATPIVPVVKQNGDIRICGDYKITLNRAAVVESYPLPRIDQLVGSLAGGNSFSKLDLAHAYQQIQLDEG